MVTNKNLLTILVLLISIVSYSFRCNKGINCTENIYSFNLGVMAVPDKDSIHVADTVWLEITEPTNLKDIKSGSNVDYGGAENLGSVISFHQLSSSKEFTIPAAGKFGYMLKQGREISSLDPNFERQYLFSEEGQYYRFKIGVIAKEKGTFRLFFSNAANVYTKRNKCLKASFSINFKNTDQHYYLSPTYQGGNLVGGDYYFKVY